MQAVGVSSSKAKRLASIAAFVLSFLLFGWSPIRSKVKVSILHLLIMIMQQNVNILDNLLPQFSHSFHVLFAAIFEIMPVMPVILTNRALVLGLFHFLLGTTFEPHILSPTRCRFQQWRM